MAGNIWDTEWYIPAILNIPPGGSLATFVPVKAGQMYVDVLAISGGSVFISGFGISRAAGTLNSQNALSPSFITNASLQICGISGPPLLASSPPFRINGPAAFWLSAGGATTTVLLGYGAHSNSYET